LGCSLLGGCFEIVGRGVDTAGDVWRSSVGATAWAYKADLGKGRVRSVEERTLANGGLWGKFRDSEECWTAWYEEPLSEGGVVQCQVILPNKWNGKLWLVANEGPGGELPAVAVAFAHDGSAVVCCDGGMGQVRQHNGRANARIAGARSKPLRKAFYREALGLALHGGKILTERKYESPVKTVNCFGRESGGTQALFLIEQDPRSVNGVCLVNPDVSFATTAAYDLNIARQMRVNTPHGRILRPSQFFSLQRAAKELNLKTFDRAKTNEIWSLAGKYDDSFSYDYATVVKICNAWQSLFSGGVIGDKARSIAFPPVEFDFDFEPRMGDRSWRLAWLFGEVEQPVSDAKFISSLNEMAIYAPKTNLKDFTDAGGKVILVLEASNARVPVQIAKPVAPFATEVIRIPVSENDAELAMGAL